MLQVLIGTEQMISLQAIQILHVQMHYTHLTCTMLVDMLHNLHALQVLLVRNMCFAYYYRYYECCIYYTYDVCNALCM